MGIYSEIMDGCEGLGPAQWILAYERGEAKNEDNAQIISTNPARGKNKAGKQNLGKMQEKDGSVTALTLENRLWCSNGAFRRKASP
ncbi:hypothetical protein PRIPAC_78713, partial [Pristionchus pacificus]|uniref:Uncharacterized protein n=1 Tax=Pristionchus pacificus TaxID=54126 RepID=A0A2A6CKE9_PRIPA